MCQSCPYVERPRADPSKKSKFSAPKPPLTICRLHPSVPLEWIKCNCTFKVIELEETWSCFGSGTHNHPKPHPMRPTSAAIKDLSVIVKVSPSLTQNGLKIGTPTQPSVTTFHPAFHNKDIVAYHRRKILKASSMESTFTSILNLNKDITFIRSSSLESDAAHITLQTEDMIQQLSESRNCPFQTDSVHDMVSDMNYDGEINVTFTSMFDIIIQRTIPVCVSIVYGQSTAHYKTHFDQVMASLSDEDYEEFIINFLGNSSDFLDAERICFSCS